MGEFEGEFAESVLQVLAPGADDDAALILREALELHDAALAEFLARFAARVRSSPAAVSAAELRSMLESAHREGAFPPPG